MAVKVVLFPVDSRAMVCVRVGVPRGRGRLRRVASACLATLAAAAGTVGFGVTPAAATTGIFTSSPASPQTIGSTPVELDWSFSLGLTGDAATCEIQRDDSDLASVGCNLSGPVAPAGTVTYQASTAGSYTLVVTPSLLGVPQPAAQSAAVVLTPAAPVLTGPTSPGADPTPHWSISSADPAATETCSLADDHGNTVDPATACSGGYTAPNLHGVSPAPAPGTTTTYTLTMTVTDDGQTASASSGYDFVTAPGAPTVTASKPLGNGRHPGFTVTGLASNASPACTLTDPHGNDVTAVALTGCGASPAIDLAGQPDGSYTLAVTQTNLAGTSSAGSDSYDLDTTAPPTLTPVGPAGPATEVAPRFDLGTPEPGAIVTCTASGSATVDCSGTDPASGDRLAVLHVAGLKNGTYTLTVTQTDAAGNTSVAGTADYLYEGAPPTAPTLTAPAQDPGTDRSPVITVSGLDDEPLAISCTVGDIPAAQITCTSGSISFDLTGRPDGPYTVAATVTDDLGRSATSSVTYILDTTAAPPIVTPKSPGVTTTAASPASSLNPTWTISDGGEVYDGPDTYSCAWSFRPAAGPAQPLTAPSCSAGGDKSFPANAGDGHYQLTVTATDELGNAATTTVDYYLDHTTAAPTITAVNPATPTSVFTPSNVTTPSWTISDSESADTFSCTWNEPGGATITRAPTVGNPSGCGGLQTFPASAGDGHYQLTVTATDVLGNHASASADYYLDATTPAPNVVPKDPAFTTTNTARSSQSAPSWIISDGGETVDGPDSLSCGWTAPGGATTTRASCSGTQSFRAPVGSDGHYSLAVTATDALGNAATTIVDYFFDSTTPAPAVALTSSAPGQPSRILNPVFAITDAETISGPETLTCTFTAPVVPPAAPLVLFGGTCPATGQFSTSGRTHGGGPYLLTVAAADALGNTVTDAAGDPAITTVTYLLDRSTPAPTVTRTNPASTPNTSASPTFSITDSESVSGPDAITCTWIAPDGTTLTRGPTATNPTDPSCAGSQTFTTNRGDGGYTLTASAKDTLGNVVTDTAGDPATTSVSYTLDTTTLTPVVTPLVSRGNGTNPVFAISDGETVSGPDSFSCVFSDPDGVQLSSGPCPVGGQFDTMGHRDGQYSLLVSATDTLGNTVVGGGALAQATAHYLLDTSTPAPAVALTTQSVLEAGSPIPVSRVKKPTVAITDGETVSTPVTLTCIWTGPGGIPISDATCPADGGLDTAGDGDGVYSLVVVGQDSSGNTNSTTFAYQLDTTPPVSPTLTPAAQLSNRRSPSFGLSHVEPNAALTCSISGASAVTISHCGPSSVVANLAAPAADGTYTIDVTATDQAGNPSAPGTAVYQLDTVAPVAPIVTIASASPSSSRTPTWYWQFGRDDLDTTSETVTCKITSLAGWSYRYPSCPAALDDVVTPTLGPRSGFDSTYLFTVTVSDQAGNLTARSVAYVVDSTVPEGPTVVIVSPRSGAGTSHHPKWRVSAPAGSTLSCELRRGDGTEGAVISAAAPCDGIVTYNLVGQPDGGYSLVARATDQAGNVSSAKSALYILAPSPPEVSPPGDQDSTAVWQVSGTNPRDRLSCTLTRGAVTVAGPASCDAHPTYDMTDLPAGSYLLSVIQIGAQDVRSAPGKASWSWNGSGSTGPGTGPTGGGGAGPTGGGSGSSKPSGSPTGSKPHAVGVLSALGGVIRKVIRSDKSHPVGLVVAPAPFRYPTVHPNQFADGFANGISSVATAIAGAGGGTGFPLLLLGLVIGFLILQNRIDRRDPKLAFTSAAADDLVEFAPPPSWKERL